MAIPGELGTNTRRGCKTKSRPEAATRVTSNGDAPYTTLTRAQQEERSWEQKLPNHIPRAGLQRALGPTMKITKTQNQTAAFIAAYTTWAFKTCGTKAVTEKGIANALKSFETKMEMSISDAYIETLHADALKNNANYAKAMAERVTLAAYPEFVKAFFSGYLVNKSIWTAKAGSATNIPAKLEDEVKELAFGKLFAGTRFQKIFLGHNSLVSAIRTRSNGKYGWKEVVWHYADYTIILNKTKTRAFVKIGNKFDVAKITKNGIVSPVFGMTITL